MFIINWVFDKLGYMPKISIDCYVSKPLEIKSLSEEPKVKPRVVKKPAVKRASTRKPKVKK